MIRSESRVHKFFFTFLLLLILCAVPGCNIETTHPNSNRPDENQKPAIKLGAYSGNISNGGLVGGGDGWVYYRSETDYWHLYKSRHDGSDRQKLSDDVPSYINVIDGYVYYSSHGDGDTLFRIRTDGTGRQQITDHRAVSVTVVGNTVYYVSYGDDAVHLPHKIKVDGTDHEVIAEITCNSLITDGVHLYVTHKASAQDNFSLYRMNMDGSGLTRLNNVYTHYPVLIGDKIIYWNVDDGRLFAMDKDGSNNNPISRGAVDVVNADETFIYYLDAADNYNVYRMKLDGTQNEKITDFPGVLQDEEPSHDPSSAFVIDGYYYYRAYHSPEVGDALMQVKPQGGAPVVW